jgi:WD40 repeat protein
LHVFAVPERFTIESAVQSSSITQGCMNLGPVSSVTIFDASLIMIGESNGTLSCCTIQDMQWKISNIRLHHRMVRDIVCLDVFSIYSGVILSISEDVHDAATPVPTWNQTTAINSVDNKFSLVIWSFEFQKDKGFIVQPVQTLVTTRRILCVAVKSESIFLALNDLRVYVGSRGNVGKKSFSSVLTDTSTLHTDYICDLITVSIPNDSFVVLSTGWDSKIIGYYQDEQLQWKASVWKESLFDKKLSSNSYTNKVNFDGHISGIVCLAFNEKHQLLITGGVDHTAIVWDCLTKTKVQRLKGHSGKILCILIYDTKEIINGKPLLPNVITSGRDNKLIIWNIYLGNAIRVIETAYSIWSFSCTMYSNYLLIIGSDRQVLTQFYLNDSLANSKVSQGGKYSSLLSISVLEVNAHPTMSNGAVLKLLIGYQNGLDFFPVELSNRNVVSHYVPEKTDRFEPITASGCVVINNYAYVVTGDGNGKIKIQKFKADTQLSWDRCTGDISNASIVQYNGHTNFVLAVAFYDQSQVNEENFYVTSKPTLSQSFAITAGSDRFIRFWRLDVSVDYEIHWLKLDATSEHMYTIRCLSVHHPLDQFTPPLLLSGSADNSAVLWNLHSLQKMRKFQNFHSDNITSILFYDPHSQFTCTDLGTCSDEERINRSVLAAITASDDGRIAVWNTFQGPSLLEDKEYVAEKPRLVIPGHQRDISASCLYVQFGTKNAPLLLTGGIDTLIIVWNLFTGEKVRTLFGHKDRVYAIKCVATNFLPFPVVVSGDDYGCVLLWNDGLQSSKSLPFKEQVFQAFYLDVKSDDWPQISDLASNHSLNNQSCLFASYSLLFIHAVRFGRTDFLVKFWDDLILVLPFIESLFYAKNPQNPRSVGSFSFESVNLMDYHAIPDPDLQEEVVHGQILKLDILSLSILTKDLKSVKVILLAWLKNLNRCMENMLEQRGYHPSFFLPKDSLILLLKNYPDEFSWFFSLLRLSEYHKTVLFDPMTHAFPVKDLSFCSNQTLLSGTQSYSVAAGDVSYSNLFETNDSIVISWKDFRTVIEACFVDFNLLRRQYFRQEETCQPVTALLVPLHDCDQSLEYIKWFCMISNQLGTSEIFDYEVPTIIIEYFWQVQGRRAHLTHFVIYWICFIIFLTCVYSDPPDRSKPGIFFINCLTLLVFIVNIYKHQIRVTSNFITSSFMFETRKLLIYFFRDVWNIIDLVTIVSGTTGLILRLVFMASNPTTQSFLAIASLCMFFKLLYFLRPFPTTGHLGKLVALRSGFLCSQYFL